MPYSSISEIPDYVKKKTKNAKKRRMWLHIFNSVYRQTRSESRAFAAANASLSRKKALTRYEIDEIIKYYITGDLSGAYEDIDGNRDTAN